LSNKTMALIITLFWFILFALADYIFYANAKGELSNLKSIIYFNIMSFFLLLAWIYICVQNVLTEISNKISGVVINEINETATNKEITNNKKQEC